MKFLSSRASAFLAGALCVAGGAFAVTGPARAETMHASYRVSLIGLPIGIAVAYSSIVEKNYKVDLNVRLTGLAALVSNLKMALASSGTYAEGAIAPFAYATTASNSRETRTLRMALTPARCGRCNIPPIGTATKAPNGCR